MDIQGRLYWRLIRKAMDNDPYFRDFTLADYRFIVANKKTKVPLVWIFGNTRKEGDIILENTILRDPLEIGRELFGYLKDRPVVPNGIELIKPNKIEDWLK